MASFWAGRPEHSLSFPVSIKSNPESEFDQDSDSAESESDREPESTAPTRSGRHDFKLTQGLLHSFPTESLRQSQPPADTRLSFESGPNLPVKPDSPQAPTQAAGEDSEPVQAGSEDTVTEPEQAQVATMSDRMFAFMMQNLTLGTQVRLGMIFCVPIQAASAKSTILVDTRVLVFAF